MHSAYRSTFWANLILLLQLQWVILSQALLDPNDFLALQTVRKSLNDLPGSNFFTSWDFTADPCGFPGVLCDGDRVITLNLGDPRAGSPGLSGRIDPTIGKLSALVELTIVPGRVVGPLPRTLSQLKSLRFLAISRNFISGEIPAGLSQLRQLKTLDLSFNQLTGAIPRPVGALPALANVVLCNNHLTGLIPPFVSQELTRFDLNHNNLYGSLASLVFPPSLHYISLSSNRLSGSLDRVFSGLNQLNFLDLSMNQLTGLIPAEIFSFPIGNLQLQRNQLFGPVEPARQVTITTVDLSFNRLSGQISPMFSTVQNLYMNNNRFTGRVPSSIVDRLLAANIQILYLQHNFLSGIEINPTVEIPLSSSLCLQYNCMVLPVDTPCPLKAGPDKARPTSQCIEWKG